MTTESEDASQPPLKPDAHSPISSATEFVSATVPQELIPTLKTDCAKLAHQTASVASPIPSVMLAMLVMISATESVLLPASAAHQDSSDIMEFAIKLVLQEPALKVVSVRELAQLVPGHTTEDATELAQPL